MSVVQQYLVDLLTDPGLGLAPHDIAVITPYARQVRALERLVESLGSSFAGVECGTVERFQGQERRAVILTTVRSSKHGGEKAEGVSTRRPIGFLADPRRLNVAISRAVAGLVIVGDFETLAKHSAQWRMLVQLGLDAGAVCGQPLERPAKLGVPVVAREHQMVSPMKASAAWDALTSG